MDFRTMPTMISHSIKTMRDDNNNTRQENKHNVNLKAFVDVVRGGGQVAKKGKDKT